MTRGNLLSESEPKEGADTPFDIVHGKVLFVADVGEVEHHRHAEKFIAQLTNDGPTASDDDLWEMVV